MFKKVISEQKKSKGKIRAREKDKGAREEDKHIEMCVLFIRL